MTTRLRRSATVTAAVAAVVGFVAVLGACSTEPVPSALDEDLAALDVGAVEVTHEVVAERANTVTATVHGRLDAAGEEAVASAVWAAYPARIDDLVVRSSDGERTFTRMALQRSLGERNPDFDDHLPSDGGGTDLTPVFVGLGLAAVGGGAVVLWRRTRTSAVDAEVRRELGVEDLSPTFVLGTRSGLDRLQPGLHGDAEGVDVDLDPASAIAERGRRARDAVVSVQDVLDIVAILQADGIADVWVGGAWARYAEDGANPPAALPSLELLADEDRISAVVPALGTVGFRSSWSRGEQASGVVRLTDAGGRVILVRAVQLVDGPPGGDEGGRPRLPRGACGSGVLSGRHVPCLLPGELDRLTAAHGLVPAQP